MLIHPDCFNWLIKQLTLNKTTFAAGVLSYKMRITTRGLLLTTAFITIAFFFFLGVKGETEKEIIISYPKYIKKIASL